MTFRRRSIPLALMAIGSFLGGYWARQPSGEVSAHGSPKALYYLCPMHPRYKSETPGSSPCCGMRLEPVYAGSRPSTLEAALPQGSIEISRAQQQLIGVQTGKPEHGSASNRLRLPGRVAVDEARLHRLISATDGWTRKLGNNPSGTFVKRNEMLATYYARELVSAQQNLLYAVNSREEMQRRQSNITANPSAGILNVQVAIDALRGLGMSDAQIDEIARTSAATDEIAVYAPVDGVVAARSIAPGQRFEKGAELFRIADLSRVWVVTDIYEKDHGLLKAGAKATIKYQGRSLEGRPSDALPQFDAESRTLKVRFELDNPGLLLRPDMFVDVEMEVTMPEAVTVPAGAVLDSGARKIIYVQRGPGLFEPRPVETGWRMGDRVQVTRGLAADENVVISGNFLLDSESRMRLTPSAAAATAAKGVRKKDLVCGMEVDPAAKNAITAQSRGRTYYFCSGSCRQTFEASPDKYPGRE